MTENRLLAHVRRLARRNRVYIEPLMDPSDWWAALAITMFICGLLMAADIAINFRMM